MYYTSSWSPPSIKRAGMDGSNPTTLVTTGLLWPFGITIDFKTSKLFWADNDASKIESSDLKGGDRRTVANLSGAGPLGIAYGNGRIYWGEDSTKKLQSSAIDGSDVTTLHTDTRAVWGVTLVADLNLPQNRTNHCASHGCAKVCVLTPTSSRCLT